MQPGPGERDREDDDHDETDQQILLDCRTYKRHVRAEQHIGTCTSVLQQIVKTEKQVLNGFLAKLKHFLKEASDGPLLIVMACDWGKHRSVGTSCLLKHVLTNIGHDVKAEHHLSKPRWSKKGCGWLPCALCDDIGDDKRALFAQVVQRYNALRTDAVWANARSSFITPQP